MRPYDCSVEAMKKFTVKPVNYEKVKEVQQGSDGNLIVFQEKLIEDFKKYITVDPSSPRHRPFWLYIS